MVKRAVGNRTDQATRLTSSTPMLLEAAVAALELGARGENGLTRQPAFE